MWQNQKDDSGNHPWLPSYPRCTFALSPASTEVASAVSLRAHQGETPMLLRGVFFIAVLGLAACFAQSGSSKEHAIVLTEASNNTTLDARAGEELRIELPAQMGTGYSWSFTPETAALFHQGLVKSLGEPTLRRPAETPGAPETQVFRLQLLHEGTAAIALGYWQPWQRNLPPQKTFRVIVHAR